MKRSTYLKGFSLIELMIVVAIIGVLSAVAAPAYRNYIYKARVSELISYAGAARQAATSYLMESGATDVAVGSNRCSAMPAALRTSGTLTSTITASWAIAPTCIITVTGLAAATGGTAVTITMTPNQALQPDGSILWTCTGGGQYGPASCL